MWKHASLLGLLLAGATSAAAAGAPDAARVIVKFRAEGRTALLECAETLAARGRRFAPATADGSDSLDRLQRELGVRRLWALFRRPDGSPFARQRGRLRARLARAAGRGLREPPDLAHVYVLELAAGGDARAAAERYRADPHVVYAQADFRAEIAALPDDPFLASSGSWGQPYRDLWGLFRIDVEGAWKYGIGEGVVVAVVDTGIDADHPDIAANLWVNPGEDLDGDGVAEDADRNGLDDDGNGFVDDLRGFDFVHSRDGNGDGDFGDPEDENGGDPFDDHGHGTHVSGTIAAVANNGIGIAGVAPGARVMALKGLDETGSGRFADLARALLYAAENGARVINASWSCSRRCPDNPLIEEVVRFAHRLGVVLVFSAGNKADDVVFYSPEKLRETLAVASTTPEDVRAETSNRGFLLDLGAPGGGRGLDPVPHPTRNILSLRSSGASPDFDPGIVAGDYLRLSGTSMAAPHVSGVAALLLGAHPELTVEDVRTALRLGALDLAPAGHDRDTGAGRLDAGHSLALAAALPRVRGAIAQPAPGALIRPWRGPVEIRGTAAGPDLVRWSLAVGRGRDPATFEPLEAARRDPVDGGVLAVWPVADLENGSYVLRLELTASDGSVLEEFAPIGIEGIEPERISSPGADAGEPDVSDDRVVWSSARSPDPERDDANLFLSDLRRGREHPLSQAPGAQGAPSISGDHVAWLDERDGDPAVFRCRWRPGAARCEERRVASAFSRFSRPAVSGDRIAWTQDAGSLSALRICDADPRSGACPPRSPVPAAAEQRHPALAGDRLVWAERRAGDTALFTCRVGPDPIDPSECRALRVLDRPGRQDFPAVSGDLVAWEDVRRFELRLRICRFDEASGTCPGWVLPQEVFDLAPAVSGRRVVWHSSAGGDDLDVFFCEVDDLRGRCPVQQLTGAPSAQRNPDVDGSRVVWEDERDGLWAIYGIAVPEMDAPGDRRVRAGSALHVPVRARDPGGGALTLRAELASGERLEDVGARFRDRGGGRGELHWRPRRAGSHVVTFTATNAAGIATSRSIRVDVGGAQPPPAAAPRREGD